ncbi:MAG: NADP-dependent succinate-semialdehyde dehydrogenase [Burkholderiales bacterium]|jgi:succinate-semialdehyde dehydrogenase/glutarate-semialdehyde dehydrogenase|nr:NADP-dependent succinate-semialdehyde dehydrogenase [Burkholderiales bacterium]
MLNWQQELSNPELIKPGLLINGEWVYDRPQQNVTNPANNEIIATICEATDTDIDKAIQNSHNGFMVWRNKTAKERAKILRKLYELIIINADDLAKIVTLEAGKPLAEAKNEILYGASYFEFFSEEAKRIYGDTIDANIASQRIIVRKEPVGVCASITPWNFPSAMLARKLAAALAAGCSMIARPSGQTPLSALALGHLAIEAGLPPGVFNLVTGNSSQISKKFCDSDIIRKISFTGSTSVGKELYQNSANTLKRMSLELGGNAPFIVFDDADLEKAVEGLIKSKFRNAGQTCVCANRVFVSNKIFDKFIDTLIPQIKKLKIGNGLKPDTNIGPLINKSAVSHSKSLIEDAVASGAQVIYGNETHNLGENFLPPVVLGDCTKHMRIFNEEIFGPVLALYSFDSDEEVIQLANDTPFGLASYFYSQNIRRIFNVSEKLYYGIVGINSGTISGENAPFGGVKHSGFGREGSFYGLDDYLATKYICLDLE